MEKISSFLKNKYIFLILFLLLLCHIPFLGADPDTLVDIDTRGAWSDEGLYSSQIRNLVNHHTFNIKENTTFIRGPLLNIIQLPFFYFFGSKLIVCRLITLISILICLISFSFYKENKYYVLIDYSSHYRIVICDTLEDVNKHVLPIKNETINI